MGGYFSTRHVPDNEEKATPLKALKRQRISDKSNHGDSPTAKRIRNTYDYVYNELFINGEGSDITIETRTRNWRLHKLYIKQSPFFSAMFNGAWRESSTSVLKLDLVDPNISEESLQIVFGALYADSLQLTEANIVGVMACATWFQLEDIRCICEEFMKAQIGMKNVIDLYEAAEQYHLTTLRDACVEWLGRVIMVLEEEPPVIDLLKSIPKSLMTLIIQSPKTFVIQIEQDLFILLIKWVFLQCHPDYSFQNKSDMTSDATTFYKTKVTGDFKSSNFEPYLNLFRSLRWTNIINVHKTATSLDNMVPERWLHEAYKNQWLRMLLTNESSDPGPQEDTDESLFWEVSERCGRRLIHDLPCTWRWIGFNFGFDMVFRYKDRTLYVARFTDRQNCEGAISHLSRRRALLHLTVAHLTPTGDLKNHATTPSILRLTMTESIQHRILSLPPDMQFPLVISANILRCEPGLPLRLPLPTQSSDIPESLSPRSVDASTATLLDSGFSTPVVTEIAASSAPPFVSITMSPSVSSNQRQTISSSSHDSPFLESTNYII